MWIDGSEKYISQVKQLFNSVIINGQLTAISSFVTKDNINDLFMNNGYSGEIDLLSIDIDGNDYHIFEAITAVNPRVIIVEYNAKFPADCEWVMPYDDRYHWDGSDKQGASLKSFETLASDKGYQLVGTCIAGVNAFFVRRDLTKNLFPLPATAENLYNPKRIFRMRSGHRSTRCLLENDVFNIPLKRKSKIRRIIDGAKGILLYYDISE